MEENKEQQNKKNESEIHSSNNSTKFSGMASLTANKSINDILKDALNSSNIEEKKKEAEKQAEQKRKEIEEKEKKELDEKLKEEIAYTEEEYIDDEELDSMINPNGVEDSPEKQKRLAELQKKYNISEISSKATDGEYKRQFDFSQNLNVRKFKIKPPKKPIIIGLVVGLGSLILGGLLAFLIINRPQPPAYIASIELAHKATESQYIGETIDLRGLNLKCTYSDDKVKYVTVKEDMITSTSANISSEYVIEKYDPQTYVELTYEGKTTKLYITVNTIYLDKINAEIFGIIAKGQVVSYDDILLTGHTSTNHIIRLDSSKAEYKINGQSITSDAGIIIPTTASGTVQIDVYHNQNGEQFTTTITLTI